VSKPRVQAIIRNMQYGDQSDADARFDMLMTWLKKTPKAVDKVIFEAGFLKSIKSLNINLHFSQKLIFLYCIIVSETVFNGDKLLNHV
jgi:hypothetical protein